MLSALLDGELPDAERARVEAHVAACAECAAHLRELRALDGFARDLGPVEAPAGYHDGLPARLRPRLRGDRPASARLVRPWVWPLAAGIALAVVAPIVLRQQHGTAPGGPPPSMAAAPQATAPEPAPAAAREKEAAPAAPPVVVTEQSRANTVGGGTLQRDAPAPKTAPAPRRLEAAPQSKSLDAFAEAPPPAAVSADAREADEESGAASGAVGGIAGGAPAGAPAEAPLQEATAERKDERARTAGALADRADGPSSLKKKSDAAYARVEDARHARDEWRRLAVSETDAGRADEARVRTIEAGVDAYRLSGDEADRRQAFRDAEAYLARRDAGQADRVRAALRRLDARR
jgi:hypothetical protein